MKSRLVIVSSLTSMYPTDIEPIHAVTAIETATVTATSMMAAITGLRALLFLRSFFNSVHSLLCMPSKVNLK